MKTKLHLLILGIVILSLSWQIAAQDIHVITITTTNLERQIVHTKDIYTRDGITNLVRRTILQKGELKTRVQQIYNEGALLGEISDDNANKVFGIYAEPNRPYALAFQFYSNKTLRSVIVGTNALVVDAFTCTNGVLFPEENSKIKKANEIGADMVDLFAPTNVHGKSPEEFNQQVERLIEKHKNP